MQRVLLLTVALTAALTVPASAQNDRKAKVENDRARFREATAWVYNDLTQATQFAKAANKPLLVVLRCVP